MQKNRQPTKICKTPLKFNKYQINFIEIDNLFQVRNLYSLKRMGKLATMLSTNFENDRAVLVGTLHFCFFSKNKLLDKIILIFFENKYEGRKTLPVREEGPILSAQFRRICQNRQ